MIESVRNMIAHAGCDSPQALRMVTVNSASALGLDADVGTVCTGGRATLTCLTRNQKVAAVMVEGIFLDESAAEKTRERVHE